MKTIGPFETKNSSISLITLTDNYLFLIKLSLNSSIKYNVNSQIPFFFSKHIPKLKSESLENIKKKYSWLRIELNSDFEIIVENDNYWKNTITIKGPNESHKLSIVEREDTDYYISVLKRFYGNRINITTK